MTKHKSQKTPKTHRCPQCGRLFRTRQGLQTHEQTVHHCAPKAQPLPQRRPRRRRQRRANRTAGGKVVHFELKTSNLRYYQPAENVPLDQVAFSDFVSPLMLAQQENGRSRLSIEAANYQSWKLQKGHVKVHPLRSSLLAGATHSLVWISDASEAPSSVSEQSLASYSVVHQGPISTPLHVNIPVNVVDRADMGYRKTRRLDKPVNTVTAGRILYVIHGIPSFDVATDGTPVVDGINIAKLTVEGDMLLDQWQPDTEVNVLPSVRSAGTVTFENQNDSLIVRVPTSVTRGLNLSPRTAGDPLDTVILAASSVIGAVVPPPFNWLVSGATYFLRKILGNIEEDTFAVYQNVDAAMSDSRVDPGSLSVTAEADFKAHEYNPPPPTEAAIQREEVTNLTSDVVVAFATADPSDNNPTEVTFRSVGPDQPWLKFSDNSTIDGIPWRQSGKYIRLDVAYLQGNPLRVGQMYTATGESYTAQGILDTSGTPTRANLAAMIFPQEVDGKLRWSFANADGGTIIPTQPFCVFCTKVTVIDPPVAEEDIPLRSLTVGQLRELMRECKLTREDSVEALCPVPPELEELSSCSDEE